MLIIFHHLILTIATIIFQVKVKVQLLVLIEASAQQRKSFVLILVKQTQIFGWVCIAMLIIVICLLMEEKSFVLKSTIKMLTFQLSFFLEVYLMDLVLLILEKYLYREVCMIFQSITILLINLIYLTFTSI